ncbi:hypothetical protein DL93DRAFT_2101708 [Clavulina sp. PMI_390]|nr:hypothetical protein DL93DRAFT_2101708 [Clavulina sp. PMI_390]
MHAGDDPHQGIHPGVDALDLKASPGDPSVMSNASELLAYDLKSATPKTPPALLRLPSEKIKSRELCKYIYDITEPLGTHILTFSGALSSFIGVGVPTIRTVSTLLSGVTAPTIQFTYVDGQTALQQSSANKFRSPRSQVPWWGFMVITQAPLYFLVGSVVGFSAGLVCFSFSAFAHTIIPTFIASCTAATLASLVAVLFWLAGERWAFIRSKGTRWFITYVWPLEIAWLRRAGLWTLHTASEQESPFVAPRRKLPLLAATAALSRLLPSEPIYKHSSPVLHVAFSPDGKSLASCGWDAHVLLWRVEGINTMVYKTLVHPAGAVRQVFWSPDGRMIVGRMKRMIVLWDVKAIEAGAHTIERATEIMSIRWLPSGKSILTVEGSKLVQILTPEKRLIVYNLATRIVEDQIPMLRSAKHLTLSANDSSVLVTYEQKGPELFRLTNPPGAVVRHLAILHSCHCPGEMAAIGVSTMGALSGNTEDDQLIVCAGKGRLFGTTPSMEADVDLTCAAWNHGGFDSLTLVQTMVLFGSGKRRFHSFLCTYTVPRDYSTLQPSLSTTKPTRTLPPLVAKHSLFPTHANVEWPEE